MREKLVITIEIEAMNNVPEAELSAAIERGLFEHYAGPGKPEIKRIVGNLVQEEPEEE